MISVKLQGRTANQMFQIACAIGYSIKWDMSYAIPQETSNPAVWERAFPHINSIPNRELPAAMFVLREKQNNLWMGDIQKPAEHVMLDGYFQSHKYFSHCYDKIRESFSVPYTGPNGYVGIHIRKGDYINYPNHHPIVDEAYIFMAIKYYYELGHRNFMVFSDDYAYWEQMVKRMHKQETHCRDFRHAIFTWRQGTPINDLQKMSECVALIGSNSSFSLMGYHLNPYEKKTCVFPKQWFGSALSHIDTSDIYPDNAIKL